MHSLISSHAPVATKLLHADEDRQQLGDETTCSLTGRLACLRAPRRNMHGVKRRYAAASTDRRPNYNVA